MTRRTLPFSPTAAVAVGLLASACADGSPTQSPGRPEPTAALAAHDPSNSRRAGGSSVQLAALPDYAGLDGASAAGTSGALSLAVDAGGAIPRFPDVFIRSVAVFGYAWVDGGTGQGVVAVIHPAIGRDSRQNPDGWHAHPVQLAGGTAGSSFCIVSIGASQGGIAIQDDRLRLHLAAVQAGLSAVALDVAAAFMVQPDQDCAATGLGVAVLAAVGL